ncbi:hypothetical protein QBC35DRAFT_447886 [Podospora australis]|uniref:Uncharacterized protein n=1 Tax=Podospora australis TaxID=1536484 RepID=A0AAN7AKJ5_9PEZI|nr:hypothetical protein QBC35DRAFT_447886 [Podospora australis]
MGHPSQSPAPNHAHPGAEQPRGLLLTTAPSPRPDQQSMRPSMGMSKLGMNGGTISAQHQQVFHSPQYLPSGDHLDQMAVEDLSPTTTLPVWTGLPTHSMGLMSDIHGATHHQPQLHQHMPLHHMPFDSMGMETIWGRNTPQLPSQVLLSQAQPGSMMRSRRFSHVAPGSLTTGSPRPTLSRHPAFRRGQTSPSLLYTQDSMAAAGGGAGYHSLVDTIRVPSDIPVSPVSSTMSMPYAMPGLSPSQLEARSRASQQWQTHVQMRQMQQMQMQMQHQGQVSPGSQMQFGGSPAGL